MNTVYYNPTFDDLTRRQLLFNGQLMVFSPTPHSLALCQFARQLIEEAFDPLDPEKAQYELAVDQYASILGKLKPAFTHHPESKRLIKALFIELGCDLQKTYFDVPKMRSSTSDGYLTTGIAYAWHPHRDTWYSAPMCQVNWWLPIYAIESENVMAFHLRYWDTPVKNDSANFNYYEHNKHRAKAAQYITGDPRPLPGPVEAIDRDPQIRLVIPVGGVVLFSGAHLHSSVPNTTGKTRFSIDFRVVHMDDVREKRGAPNIDAACSGTTMRDYLCGSDFSHISDDIISQYDDGTERSNKSDLIYQPDK